MKQLVKYIAFASVVFNVYLLTTWILICSRGTSHQQNVELYQKFSLGLSSLLILGITMLSLAYLVWKVAQAERAHKVVFRVALILQSLLFGLSVWTLL